MLKTEHFRNCEVQYYINQTGVWETDSGTALDLLDAEYIDGIDHIGFFFDDADRPFPPFVLKNAILVDYYHIESINPNSAQPPEHHLNSYKTTWDGPSDWDMICQHSIRINYPEICLLKELYEKANEETQNGLHQYIKHAKYFDIKSMDKSDAVWFMAHVLGAHD